MEKELIIRKCLKCGAVIKEIKDSKSGFKCCGEEMKKMVANTEEAAFEKHIPTYEVVDDKIIVKVNHVMEEEHYIEWITILTEEKECTVFLKPGKNAECKFKYVPGAKLYAYCNKHGLWSTEVK